MILRSDEQIVINPLLIIISSILVMLSEVLEFKEVFGINNYAEFCFKICTFAV